MTSDKAAVDRLTTECIDPELGNRLWLLDTPDCPEELAARLDHHLRYCAACRLRQAVAERVEAGLRDGSLVVRPDFRGRFAAWSGGLGAVAVAAGLAVLLLLPPRAPHEALVLRGEDGPIIESPVPDEVVRGERPTIRWTPLAGATRYEVRVSAVDGGHDWSVSTRVAETAVPETDPLAPGTRYRIRVEPVPGHLAPDGALRSSFRTGSTGAWLRYRLERGAPAGRWLGGAGLLGLLAGAVGALVRRGLR